MKVYLLPVRSGEYLFYSEAVEAAGEAEAGVERGGVRGWAEQKYKSLQSVLNESESGVGLRVRRAWEWLQRRTAPDEPLLRSLRGAREIKLVHPASLSAEDVRERWDDYLSSRKRRHTLWLVLNAIVSPLTLLLAPLPGPNVIGYWFIYRAVCHLLARLGIRRAQSMEDTALELLSSEALNETLEAADAERIDRVANGFGLKGLAAYLERVKGTGRARRDTRLAAS